MQWKLFVIGMIVAVSLNVDAIKLTKTLYHNQALRKQVAAAADVYLEENKNMLQNKDSLKLIVKNIDETYHELQLFDLPIGWEKPKVYSEAIRERYKHNTGLTSTLQLILAAALKLFGWILTAVAVSFGAPFWFELLNKLVDIRKSGKKPVNGETKKS